MTSNELILASKRTIQSNLANYHQIGSGGGGAASKTVKGVLLAAENPRRKLRPWSTVRNDNKSKQYSTMLRAQ